MFKRIRRAGSWVNGRLGRVRGGPLVVLVGGLIGGMVIVSAFAETLIHTSTESFCAYSCHEMADNVTREFQDSIHNKNRTGVRATCSDCHVPKSTIPLYFKKMGALHDLWGHYITKSISTPEKFEAKRYELAVRVWTYMKSNDSRECRSCHDAASMLAEEQSEKAQVRHQKGIEENLTCIDCHFAIAHNEPEGPGPQEIKVVAGRIW